MMKFKENSKKQLNQDELIAIAINCILTEARSYPSLGLVSQYDSGCHKDMNFNTLVASAETFKVYFHEIFNLVKNDQSLNFHQLRKLGLEQEIRMYQATNNINTHKGLIFHFGIIFYIVIYQNIYQTNVVSYSLLIQKLTSSLKFDFCNLSNKNKDHTKGEKLYLQYQITGARGIAINGYQIIFNDGLDFLRRYQERYPKLNQEQLALILLIFYLSKIEDTTLISKIGYDKTQEIIKNANEWLNILVTKDYDQFYQVILNNNKKMILDRVSPGGCADLVVITLFLNQVFTRYGDHLNILAI